ncbi:MAG: phage tail assembly protein [Acetatifactor sp.]|nr:phage tail assembly protein [Acetatifactor sp.]
MAFQTEYDFILPRGYLDQNGVLHREGTMRLANAADEILPLRDSRVQQNPGYLTIILLARVVTKLGSLSGVDTHVIENLYTMDLAYLQDLYQRINTMETPVYKAVCPHCSEEIEVPVNFMEAGPF